MKLGFRTTEELITKARKSIGAMASGLFTVF
jgi:hypothetical protein